MYQPQCHLFESTYLCAALQVSVLPSNIQRDLVSVPLSQLGLNNGTIYRTHGKKQFFSLMDHGGRYNNTGYHLQDLIEYKKLEIGCSGPLFDKNFQALYNCINPSWIAHTWQFMQENNLSTEETIVHLLPQRQNDSFITGDMMATGIEGKLLAELNICRKYLRLKLRSDIATGNGK